MATSLNEIVYNILNIYRGGNTSDNEKIQKRQIAFMVDYYRALFIKQDLMRKTAIDKNLISDLGCVSVIEVDRAECCKITTPCVVLRTKMKIPGTVSTASHANLFTFVGLVDKITPFQFTSKVQSRWSKYNKYTKAERRAYYHNGYIYITNEDDRLKYINIHGIFEKPSELKAFNNCEGAECVDWDSKYPVPEWMISAITEMILSKELRIEVGSTNDETNNATKQPTQEPQTSI